MALQILYARSSTGVFHLELRAVGILLTSFVYQVLALGPYEVDSSKFNNVPPPQYLPASYVNTGHNLQQMGAHRVDGASPELHGKPFTETFILGSFDGRVTFYEPMITLDFLKNEKKYERAIPVPSKFQEAGWYPTIMRVVKQNGETEVVRDGFVYRQKS